MIRTFATRSNALRALKDISIAAVVHATVLITETPEGKFSFRESLAEQYLTEQEEVTYTLNTQESIMNVQTATTAELVAFYNAHTEAQIKKFRDRATAEKKVQSLLETLAAAAATYAHDATQVLADEIGSEDPTDAEIDESNQDVFAVFAQPLAQIHVHQRATKSETQAETMKTSLKLVRTITCLDTGETWKNAYQMYKAHMDWMTSGQQDRLTAKLYAAAKEGRYEVVEINGRKFQLVGA